MAWWSKKQREPKVVNVGKTTVTINTVDGKQHVVTLVGWAMMTSPWGFLENPWISSSRTVFEEWQKRIGVTGLVPINDDTFIPLGRVETISAVHDDYEVQVQ